MQKQSVTGNVELDSHSEAGSSRVADKYANHHIMPNLFTHKSKHPYIYSLSLKIKKRLQFEANTVLAKTLKISFFQ